MTPIQLKLVNDIRAQFKAAFSVDLLVADVTALRTCRLYGVLDGKNKDMDILLEDLLDQHLTLVEQQRKGKPSDLR